MQVNRLAEKIARYYYRVTFKEKQVSFLDCFSNHKDCLVLMPSDMNVVLEAASKLPKIAEIFPDRVIKILLTSNIDPRSHEFIKRFTIIKPYSYDLNAFYLPKKPFIDRIKDAGLSVCIDLDFQHNFLNSSVSAMAEAPVRIGCTKGLGLPYYNLEINVGDINTPAKIAYETFVDVLYNLKGEGSKIVPSET
jgi:hypothetical protein